AGRLPFTPGLDQHRQEQMGNRWRQWGRMIVAHPWTAMILAGAPLILLATQAARLNTELPRGNWLPPAAESVHALGTLQNMGRAGIVQSLRVILELPSQSI